MRIQWITCPECRKQFYVKEEMLETRLPFHCPFCDLYFRLAGEGKRRSPEGAPVFE